MHLSTDQEKVYRGICSWMKSGGPILTVGGFAGTGKSTLLSVLARESRKFFAFACYTGRASSVLRRKLLAEGVETTSRLKRKDNEARGWRRGRGYFDDGLPMSGGLPFCSTIHKLLYRPVIDNKTQELKNWVKRKELDRSYDFIVVDEASMISDEILEDITRHGVRVLAVGDHGQLPPVMAKGDLMAKPMLRLEKIHRQAEGNPIIGLSKHLREGGRLSAWKADGKAVAFVDKEDAAWFLDGAFRAAKPLEVGVLSWTNRKRVQLNGAVRIRLGHDGSPKAGEVVICLQNRPPVYNGMRGLVTRDTYLMDDPSWLLEAHVEFPEEGIPAERKELCIPQFCRENTFRSLDELKEKEIVVEEMPQAGELYDFGYAMTVHKAQGSQFVHAMVYLDRKEKPAENDYRRWIYTAVTRASERLTVFL